jgi:hypothetical protein
MTGIHHCDWLFDHEGDPINSLLRLTLNHVPPDVHLPRRWNYKHESPVLSIFPFTFYILHCSWWHFPPSRHTLGFTWRQTLKGEKLLKSLIKLISAISDEPHPTNLSQSKPPKHFSLPSGGRTGVDATFQKHFSGQRSSEALLFCYCKRLGAPVPSVNRPGHRITKPTVDKPEGLVWNAVSGWVSLPQ